MLVREQITVLFLFVCIFQDSAQRRRHRLTFSTSFILYHTLTQFVCVVYSLLQVAKQNIVICNFNYTNVYQFVFTVRAHVLL